MEVKISTTVLENRNFKYKEMLFVVFLLPLLTYSICNGTKRRKVVTPHFIHKEGREGAASFFLFLLSSSPFFSSSLSFTRPKLLCIKTTTTMLENTKLLVIPDLNKFISSLDCSETVDIITNKPLNDYQVPLTEKTLLVSLLSCTEISNRVQLMLTPDYLIFCSNDNRLLYNATPIKHVSIQTARSDNELIGEYSFQLLIHTQKLFTMVSKFQDERNMWLGIDKNNNSDTAKSFSSWRPLKDVAEIYNATPKFRIDATQPIDVKDARTEETLSSVSSFDEEG